jgi:hypothetical protein
MLATEEPGSPSTAHATQESTLERWPANERMRHVPSLAWIVDKLDVDVRQRLEKLWLPYSDLPASDPRHPALEAELRAVARALDRVSDVARRHRGNVHPPNDLGSRIGWSVSQAVASLKGSDSETFGRRLPFQTFERSNAEPLWAAVLTVIQHLHALTELVRAIDRGIDERLYEGMVQLKEPLRRDPIA